MIELSIWLFGVIGACVLALAVLFLLACLAGRLIETEDPYEDEQIRLVRKDRKHGGH